MSFGITQAAFDSRFFKYYYPCYIQMIANDEEESSPSPPPFSQPLPKILISIGLSQSQLQAMRETLNQQLLFNLEDLFKILCQDQQITSRDLINFIGISYNQATIQSVIRHYNGNTSPKLSRKDLARVFLTRQNKLLAKLVHSRISHGRLSPPILNYIKKIIVKEAELHEEINSFRKATRKTRNQIAREMDRFCGDGRVQPVKLKKYIMEDCKGKDIGCEIESIVEYFDFEDGSKAIGAFQNTLLKDNSEVISTFLNKKQKHQNTTQVKNPLVHEQFHKLLSQPQLVHHLSYRQAKSIEKHLKRVNSNRRCEISKKVDQYRRLIEKQVRQLCVSLKDIVWLEKEIEYARIQLSLCMDFNSALFFSGFCLERNNKLIPSAMEDYLKRVGAEANLSQIYLLFKRFSKSPDGKMDVNDFSSIFDPIQQQYREIKRSVRVKTFDDVSSTTKKAYLQTLTTTLRNEGMIEKIRQHLQSRKYFDIRNIFNCIDTDEDGYVSVLDMHVLFKKNIEFDLARLDIKLLLARFGKRNPREMISYDEFVYQMAPRTAVITANKSKLCL